MRTETFRRVLRSESETSHFADSGGRAQLAATPFHFTEESCNCHRAKTVLEYRQACAEALDDTHAATHREVDRYWSPHIAFS